MKDFDFILVSIFANKRKDCSLVEGEECNVASRTRRTSCDHISTAYPARKVYFGDRESQPWVDLDNSGHLSVVYEFLKRSG